MSVQSQDTFAADGVPLTVIGGGATAVSTFSTFTISTLNAVNVNSADVNSLFTSTTFLTANDAFMANLSALIGDISTLTTDFFSTNIAEIDEAYISSLSTKGIYLDGALLTTVGNELLLNGIPLATTSNISSVADWALDPAVSTVQMNGNALLNASYVSTVDLAAAQANITNLVCQDISTVTLTAISTIHAISSISSSVLEVQNASASSLSTNFLNGAKGVFSSLSSVQSETQLGFFSTLSTSVLEGSAGYFSSINDQPVVLNSANWAQFKADQDVNMGLNNLNSTLSVVLNGAGVSTVLTSGAGNTLLINGAAIPEPGNVSQWATFPATSTINVNNQGLVSDNGFNITQTSEISMLAQNGLQGAINLRAAAGAAGIGGGAINLTADGGNTLLDSGLFGAIRLTANSGTAAGITTGGLISLTANSGGALANLTSAVKLTGGSVVSYAGLVNPIGSLFGYNYVYGTAGVSVTAGLPPGALQTPGTVYVYGLSGIVLNSDVYTTAIYPYWSGLGAPANLSINGRTTIDGSASVVLNNVATMSMEGSGAITGLNTINGTAYPPVFALPENVVVSTLTAFSTVFTSSLMTSSINGSAYPPTFVPPEDLVVSTLTTPSTIFTSSLITSSINGLRPTNISTAAGLFSGSVRFAQDSNVFLFSDPIANTLTYGLNSNISSLNSIQIDDNGFINCSTLTGVSSISGVAWPPATGSIMSSITNGGSYVTIDGSGVITLSAETNPFAGVVIESGGVAINAISTNMNLNCQHGNFFLLGPTNSAFQLRSNGDILMNPGDSGGRAGLYKVSTIECIAGKITGVSSINGVEYPPPLSADIIVSTLTVNSSIVGVSSINGVAFPGVTSLNTLTGSLTLAADTNITITPSASTLTIQAKNFPISERATNAIPINLTATTFATAQTILTFTITSTFVADIDINSSFYYQTNSNTQYDIIYYAQIDGAQVGVTMKDSLAGVNHFSAVSIIASALSQSIGLHTVTIKAYAGSAPAAGNLTVIACSGYAIANLV